MIARRATIEDLPGIHRIIDGYSDEIRIDRARTIVTLDELVRTGQAMAAVHLGQVVGGVAGYLMQSGFSGEAYFVVMFLYLRPRRRKHTRWLLYQAEIFAHRIGATKIMFGIPSGRDGSEKLLRFFRICKYSLLEVHVTKDVTHA